MSKKSMQLLGLAALGIGGFFLLKNAQGEQAPQVTNARIDFATAGVTTGSQTFRSTVSITNTGSEFGKAKAFIEIHENLANGNSIQIIRSNLLPELELDADESDFRGFTKILAPLGDSTGWDIVWEVTDLDGKVLDRLTRNIPRE